VQAQAQEVPIMEMVLKDVVMGAEEEEVVEVAEEEEAAVADEKDG